MHWRGDDPESSVFLSQRDVRELQFAKASIATGWEILLGELGVDAVGHLAGAARRLVRPVPLGVERDPHRARAADGAPADRLGGQRRGGGGEDRRALAPRARRGRRDRARGPLRRALRPRGLQRPVHRPAARSRDERRRRDRLRGARGRRAAGRRASAAGRSTSTRSRRCCTTGRRRSPTPSTRRDRPAEPALRPRRRRLRGLRHLRRARRR